MNFYKIFPKHSHNRQNPKCVTREDANKVMNLIRGDNLEEVNYANETALHHACIAGATDVVLILLHAGANVNQKGDEDWTPLHHACWNSRSIGTVIALLKYGADVNSVTNNGDTPLMLSVVNGGVEIMEILMGAGANLLVQNNNGEDIYDFVSVPGRKVSKKVRKFLETQIMAP